MKIKYMKKCLLLMGFCMAQANMKEIDLHGQRIGIWNMGKVNQEIPDEDCDKTYFTLNLSDNFIDDESMEELADILANNNEFAKNLIEINLSNNRMSSKSFDIIISMLKKYNKLKWINLAINSINSDDFCPFFDKLLSSFGSEGEEMAKKIVWLPWHYNVDRFFSKSEPFYTAYIKYYEEHPAKEDEKINSASSS